MKKSLLRYIRHLLVYRRLLYVWSDLPKTKFIIITQSRSGGGLLNTLLSNHPDLHVDGEIFNTIAKNFKVISPMRYLRARSKKCVSLNKNVYGFKLKYHHLAIHQGLGDLKANRFIERLAEDDWKFIYLRRNNILRLTLSSQIAQKRAYRHIKKYSDISHLQKVQINCASLLKDLEELERIMLKDEEIMNQIPNLLIEYERDLLNSSCHTATCRKIFKYLNIRENVEVQSNLRRTSTDDISDTVENYAELEATLKNTKYMKWLDQSQTL